MKELKQRLIRLCFCHKETKKKKKDRSKLKKKLKISLCLQAFYCATGEIVQINATEMYVTIPFLNSLSKLLRAYSVKYFSKTEKSTQDHADFENKINLFSLMELKATHRFPEALLTSSFIGIVKRNA